MSILPAMAQRIPILPANAHSHHAMPSEFSHNPDDFLVDIVDGSDSDYDAQLNRKKDTKHRKKQSAPVLATYHCWKLTKAAPKTKDSAPSWKRAEVVQMTLPSGELESQVKKQRKARSLIEMYEALSTDQRQQVEVLIQQQRQNETNKYARWEIAAIHRETLNNLRTRIRETTFIRVILSRDDKRNIEKAAPNLAAPSASVASNISDLNDLPNPLLKQTEMKNDQRLPPPRREFRGQARARKTTSEDIIEVVPESSIDNIHIVNVPSIVSPPPPARLQSPNQTWSNQAPLWPSSSINIEQETMRLGQSRPQLATEPQSIQQLHPVQNAFAYMANVDSKARTQVEGNFYEEQQVQPALPESWFPRHSPPIVLTFEYHSYTTPNQQPIGTSMRQVTPPQLSLQSTNDKRDYFEQQFSAPYGVVAEPNMSRQHRNANNNAPKMVDPNYAMDPEPHRLSPSTQIQVATDTDWPDYNPEMELSPLPPSQPQHQIKHTNQSAERLRREDVLFWRTQAQLSHSRSFSSLDDQSSTIASPEQSSPPTSVSGDGIAPQFHYHERDGHMPGRFGQQLAAHGFLRPNQDRQRERPPRLPQKNHTDYKPPTRRGVSFEDESLGFSDGQHAPHPFPNARDPSMYSPDTYTRPSVPDPPEPKASYSPYHPQRYQPQQSMELDHTSMLERLNERLDHMELRQAEGATRRAVEAAQKRRDLEKKEAYERGIEDAMAWKARSGGFGSFD